MRSSISKVPRTIATAAPGLVLFVSTPRAAQAQAYDWLTAGLTEANVAHTYGEVVCNPASRNGAVPVSLGLGL